MAQFVAETLQNGTFLHKNLVVAAGPLVLIFYCLRYFVSHQISGGGVLSSDLHFRSDKNHLEMGARDGKQE